MKTLTLIIFTLCVLFTYTNRLYAQQTPSIRSVMDSIFSGLEADSVPSGILIDKSFTKGVIAAHAATIDTAMTFSSFYSLYNGLQDGAFDRNGAWAYSNFRQAIKEQGEQDESYFYLLRRYQ